MSSAANHRKRSHRSQSIYPRSMRYAYAPAPRKPGRMLHNLLGFLNARRIMQNAARHRTQPEAEAAQEESES